MKKFLVPVDFSLPSESAAEYVIEITKYIQGTEIILYHVSRNFFFSTTNKSEEEPGKLATDHDFKI